MKEIFESKLKILTQDENMLEALKFVFNKRIDKERPNIGETDDNHILGQKYRAYEEAKRMLLAILLDIDSYQDKKVESDNINKGK